MQRYWLTRLADHELIREVTKLVSHERQNTADLLAHLAEVDARKLYAPAGYDSMYAWCVGVLGFSEDVACKRIEAARTARRFPAVFDAIATGRLHLSGVLMLAPHLTTANAADLLAAAAGRTRAQIAELLAERFPRPDAPTRFALTDELALEAAGESSDTSRSAPGRINFAAAEQMAAPEARVVSVSDRIADRAKLTPLSSDRIALQPRWAGGRRSSFDMRRHCSATRSRPVMSPECSSGRSTSWWNSSRSGASRSARAASRRDARTGRREAPATTPGISPRTCAARSGSAIGVGARS